MNPFYNAMNQQNPMQMLNALKSNPVQFLMERKFNLPKGINANDPQKILEHLLRTGQVTQQQVDAAYQKLGQFKK